MKQNNELVALALVFLLGSLAAGSANALTTIGQHQVDAAPVDPLVYAGNGGHAVYFSGNPNDYLFSNSAGSLVEYDDGTATLSGMVYSNLNPNAGYIIDVDFFGYTAIAPPGSPKKELTSGSYTENGGSVDTDTWYFYTSFVGTLTGVGDLAGTVLTITPRGPAMQIGVGANGKNLAFGASAWFDAVDQDGQLQEGDFNLNLTSVPVPAGLPLLLGALASLGFFGRRD